MKFFLDTANVDQVREIAAWGILDGVTTNPSFIAKEGKDFKETILAMCELAPCVSAQVTATDVAGMIKQGEEYAKWHKHVVVKVPMTIDGLKVVKHLSSKKIKTNVTLVFSVTQAMLAAKAGATIVSPFIGRIDDTGTDCMHLINDMMDVWAQYGFETEVLVASVRSPMRVIDCAKMGAHIATVPYDIMKKMVQHPLTDTGLKKFRDDWETVKK